jgi:L-threonylcarbamoyladenylate synthase
LLGVRRWRWGDPVEVLGAALAAGRVIAIPTESSYALGVDPRDPIGVEAVFALKGRAADQALPVVIDGAGRLADLAVRSGQPALAFACHWPAPLSLVLATDRRWPAASDDGSIAVRVPAHQRLRGLLASLGRPLTATSANRSGEPPLLEPDAVVELLGASGGIVVDDGSLAGGQPSTLVSVDSEGTVRILRRGAFDPDRLPRAISAASVENPVDGVRRTQVLRGAERNA